MLNRRLIALVVLAFVGLGALILSHKWRAHRQAENVPQAYQPPPAPRFSDVKEAAKTLATSGIELYDSRTAIDPEVVADDAQVRITHIAFTAPSQITEESIKLLRDLPDLKSVSCYDTGVRDEDLSLLGRLSQIVGLNLNYTQISDKGLQHLSELTSLFDLRMNGTAVTDVGLAYIAGRGMPLSHLSLYDTKVTDEGLAHLEPCRGLVSLDVQKTQVTPSGAAALRKKHPHCHIFTDPY